MMQKAYGKQVDLEAFVEGFTMILQDEFSVDEVCWAISRYLKTKEDLPTPASIVAILKPEKPRPTYAQYKEALDWQKRNNFPMFSWALEIIAEYEAGYYEKIREYDEVKAEQELLIAEKQQLLLESDHIEDGYCAETDQYKIV